MYNEESIDHPDLNSNNDNAVLFADIVGSSRLYTRLGNALAQQEIDRLITLMIQIIQAHGGLLVKTIGDEIMVVFADVECAAESAIALNLKIQEQQQTLRIGLAFGALVFDGPDVFGNTVNRAASLVTAAQSKQILMDQALFELLPKRLANVCELYDRLILKGSDDKASVFRLNWQNESSTDLQATQVGIDMASTQSHFARELEITLNNETFYFLPTDEALTFGRDPAVAEHVISSPMVSRLHGVISFNRGKFTYEDRSTNGSYLEDQTGKHLYLRRESVPLIKDGRILLGSSDAQCKNVIIFSCMS